MSERDADAHQGVGVVAVYLLQDCVALLGTETRPLGGVRVSVEISDRWSGHEHGVHRSQQAAFTE